MDKLVKKLKNNLVSKLTANDQIMDNPYLIRGNKTYTMRQLSIEIENDTDFGVEFLTDMIMLSIDLTARQITTFTYSKPYYISRRGTNTIGSFGKDIYEGTAPVEILEINEKTF
jgi:hypothetical protein